MISNTFCILPWIHFSTRPNGHVRVCCTANASSAGKTNDKKYGGEIGILKEDDGNPSNLGIHDMNQSWNNRYMRTTRLMMLNGEEPPQCSKCFIEERAGHISKRIWETEYWSRRLNVDQLMKDTNDDGSIPEIIRYIDLRMGTKCNLKCIMCSPHDSSLWMSDWRKLYPKIKNDSLRQLCGWSPGSGGQGSYEWYKNNPAFWEQLYNQIPNLKQLYFAGGEALIMNEHYNLLQKIVDDGYADKIELRYNSNGTYLPDRLFELWDKFYHVRFHFSIDSYGDMNDYIRFPPMWGTIEKNLHRLDNTPDNIEVTIACAVQALNIYYLPELIKWKLAEGFKKVNPKYLGAGMINCHLVYHPAFLNVKIFPQWFKEEVKEKHEQFYKWLEINHRNDKEFFENPYGIKRFKGLVRFMMSDDWSNRMPEFREYITLMDEIRGTDFRKTFPEMGRLLDE